MSYAEIKAKKIGKKAVAAWIDKEVLNQAKCAAYARGFTLTQVIETALRDFVRNASNETLAKKNL